MRRILTDALTKGLSEGAWHDYDGRASKKEHHIDLEKACKSDLVVINFSPCGQKLDQTLIEGFVTNRGDNNRRHCLICGRYEGIESDLLKNMSIYQ